MLSIANLITTLVPDLAAKILFASYPRRLTEILGAYAPGLCGPFRNESQV